MHLYDMCGLRRPGASLRGLGAAIALRNFGPISIIHARSATLHSPSYSTAVVLEHTQTVLAATALLVYMIADLHDAVLLIQTPHYAPSFSLPS